MPRKTILTLLALTLLVGATAAPVLAQGDDDRRGRDDRPDRGPRDDGNRSLEPRARGADDNRSDGRGEGGGPGHHVAQRCREAANETGEVPDACKRAAKAHRIAERCRAGDDNGTVSIACERLKDVHSGAHQARRAAHAILGAIDAMEARIDRIDNRSAELQAELDAGNHTEENATKIQERIDRLAEHRDRTQERIDHLQERIDAIKARWEAAREHAEDWRARHGDDDAEDEEPEQESEEESEEGSDASGNETVEA